VGCGSKASASHNWSAGLPARGRKAPSPFCTQAIREAFWPPVARQEPRAPACCKAPRPHNWSAGLPARGRRKAPSPFCTQAIREAFHPPIARQEPRASACCKAPPFADLCGSKASALHNEGLKPLLHAAADRPFFEGLESRKGINCIVLEPLYNNAVWSGRRY